MEGNVERRKLLCLVLDAEGLAKLRAGCGEPKSFIPDVTQEIPVELAVEAERPTVPEVPRQGGVPVASKEETPVDEKELEAAALAGSTPRIRLSAVRMLWDQDVLQRVARVDDDVRVRIAAVERIQSQVVLAELAQSQRNGKVRLTAVRCLDDIMRLTELAGSARFKDVKKAAAERLAELNLAAE